MEGSVKNLRKLVSRVREKIEVHRNVRVVAEHFDQDFYLSHNPDVCEAKVNPLVHYLRTGWQEGRDPNEQFSTAYYLFSNPDVLVTQRNPLVHYIKHGKAEGRSIRPPAPMTGARPACRPYFITPVSPVPQGLRVAVHYHVFYPDMVEDFARRLSAVPVQIDLFVSVPAGHLDIELLRKKFQEVLPDTQCEIQEFPNRGRDLGPFVAHFAEKLSAYDVIGHFHTKKSPHNPLLDRWNADILDALIGCGGKAGRLPAAETAFTLITSGQTSWVTAPPPLGYFPDADGWGQNRNPARCLLERIGSNIGLPDMINFPQGSMFWTGPSVLKQLAHFRLNLADFPIEPIPADGTVAHALERMLFLLAPGEGQQPHVLYADKGPQDAPFYEAQEDFSATLDPAAPKVLAYYLPQFHPTPENDEWHGPGFTEWTKVRDAQPLFQGHQQQRQPHPDIGYYLLTPDTLRKQAEIAKKAGVGGFIFYHYWFSGRMILERPAQELLANPDIELPYCFCWANENWTRRWDGSDKQVLLEQKYSADDARAFIEYLIPFFRDPRYLRHEGRPIIFIYRPSLMPTDLAYVDIWRAVCKENGLPAPYVVGTLKDIPASLIAQKADAAVERVLHDWMGSAAKPIDNRVQFYEKPATGILDYSDVVRHYIDDRPTCETLPVLRSIVPCFDNTPRYGSRAHITHAPRPDLFESWLTALISQARGADGFASRFVVVNAWNEWGETAMIEPDTRFGYAYLNAIGRVLSGDAAQQALPAEVQDVSKLQLHLQLPGDVCSDPRYDLRQHELMIAALRQTAARGLRLSVNSQRMAQQAGVLYAPEAAESSFVARIRRPFAATPDCLYHLVLAASQTPDEEHIPTWYPKEFEKPLDPQGRLSRLAMADGYYAPFVVTAPNFRLNSPRMLRFCPEAFAALTLPDNLDRGAPFVDTIVRVHGGARFSLLERALLSLIAQASASVRPIVIGQDLSNAQQAQVDRILQDLPWRGGVQPEACYLSSTRECPDLRATALQTGLGKVRRGALVGFLDYDDLLFADAYQKLNWRLIASGKALAFGRVYRTVANKQDMITARERTYQYGFSYEEFLERNHAPIHSYLLDSRKVDLSRVNLPKGMRFLEDYMMLMQLAERGNADWDGLSQNIYVGDYMHYSNGAGTLSIVEGDEREKALQTEDYQVASALLDELRRSRKENP
ncbi:glycoside hydrolase family 99-like domain-containing protein [Paracoccus sp. WLY502]|uniref:glycoside hydrolase family 99-like domain-containing protein n=1 Tax=Paracoccus yibinensis TaxID=3068891 RepID=UPI00279685EA|nr:glycoside hydrolase family 99-like domain-containing protein [Paracoccus sp. WLY502]MDQ1902450.1 glycoside hydrolase family 99-like domain-containing protein [Paracoccus sp. WLY502]